MASLQPQSRQPRPAAVILLLLTVLLASMTLPSVTLAARPVETRETTWGAKPGAITTADGRLDFFVSYSDLPNLTGDFTYRGRFGNLQGVEGAVSLDGNRLTGEMPTWNAHTGEFLGNASYAIDFTIGGPSVTVDDLSEGNRRFILTTTRYATVINGWFTLPNGAVFPIINRPGSHNVFETWSNAPASMVLDGHETFVAANWLVGDLDVQLTAYDGGIFRETFVTIITPEGELIGAANIPFDGERLVAELELRGPDQSPAGTASIDVSVRTVASSKAFEDRGYERVRVITDEVVTSGTVSVTIADEAFALDLDDAFVEARRSSWHGIRYPSKGDEPQG